MKEPNTTMLPELKRVKQTDFSKYEPTAGRECTYFIQAKQGGLIKIGGTTHKPASRLRAIQLCCPVPLHLLAVADGLQEARAHYIFRNAREYGEWFRPIAGLLEFLKGLEKAEPVILSAPRKLNARREEQPEHGVKLRERRRDVRKSLDYISTESNGLLYKQLLYRLENGLKRPESLTAEQSLALATSLEWTLPELNSALGTGFA